MKIFSYLLVFLMTGCSSVRLYEEIVEGALEDYQSDSISHHVNSWVPINAPVDFEPSDEVELQSIKDKESCLDSNRGIECKDGAFAVVLFMQCMNEKGWRLRTEDVLVVGH